VHALIDDVVREANEQLAQVEQVKQFTLIGKELDHEDGELTATQKVKRRAMEHRFEKEIGAMYS
jgi:long-chain acyl-CoA synthetase